MPIAHLIWVSSHYFADFIFLQFSGINSLISIRFSPLYWRRKSVQCVWIRSSCASAWARAMVFMRRFYLRVLIQRRDPSVGFNETQRYLLFLHFFCVSFNTGALHLIGFHLIFSLNRLTDSERLSELIIFDLLSFSSEPIVHRHVARSQLSWIYLLLTLHGRIPYTRTCIVPLVRLSSNWNV